MRVAQLGAHLPMREDFREMKENTHSEKRASNRWIRYSMVAATIVFVGIVDVVRALVRHDIVDAVWVAAIFFVVCPVVIYLGWYSSAPLFGKRPK